MIYPASRLTSYSYRWIAKPILFRLKPDNVHDAMVQTTSTIQKSGIVRGGISSVYAYKNDVYLSQTIHGIEFKNPIGLSAGFDKNFETCQMMKAFGYGFMEGGSITAQPCKGNPRPWFHRLPKSKGIVVHAGLANQGAERIIERIKSYPNDLRTDFPLNISVAKTNSPNTCSEDEAIDDYIAGLTAVRDAKVGDMITINISCPNTYGGEPFNKPKKLGRLLDRVDKLNLKQPVFLKMPSDLSTKPFEKLCDVAAEHKVSGLTMTNLLKDYANPGIMRPDLRNTWAKTMRSSSPPVLMLTQACSSHFWARRMR
jgi:dihydroorotate dehydrogenase